jgi:Tfp pilus assembly protein PilF
MAYYYRALAKQAKGDTNGAQADFKKAINLNPKLLESVEAKTSLTNGTSSK